MRMSAIDYQLYNEIWRGNAAGVKDAIARGADVNSNYYSDDIYSDIWGWSPLMAACGNEENFSLPIVKLLLDNGAQVNDKDYWGETPLMKLGKSGNCSERALNLLLDAGADINATGGNEGVEGVTFLMYAAASYLTPGILELAVKRGANINQENEWGNTALYYAIRTGSSFTIDIADAFARCGAKAAPENKGILALTRLALMYPETDSKLEEEIGRDLSESFLPLLEYFPDASASFWTNVLNVLSREHGKSEKLKKYYSYHAKKMTKVLSAVFDHSPDTAVRFINKRLGAEVLEMWENEKVPGARDLNERLFALLRKRLEGMDVPFPSGYVL